jgi:hypothetical protein
MRKFITLLMAVLCLCSVSAADFNNDGKQDYLLASDAGRLAIWHLNGNNFVSGVYGPTIPAGWSLAGTGDFNLDGYPDLLLYNATTKQTAVWYLHDGTLLGGVYGPTFTDGFVPMTVDDWNGDGKPDIIAFNPSTRQLRATFMNGYLPLSVSQTRLPQFRPHVTTSAETPTTDTPEIKLAQSVLAVVPPNWAVVESANHQINLVNMSTFQTAVWDVGWNGSSLFIGSGRFGPTQPAGWKVIGFMDFNLDGWNDYLLGGAFGKNAQWRLNNSSAFIGGVYGPTLPAGFSFAQQRFKTCSFGVFPTGYAVPVGGGSFTVNVVTEFGCKWYYHSNTAGITVSAGSQPRIGGGSIFVTVSPTAPAVGSIWVQGQTIVITRGVTKSKWSGTVTGNWTVAGYGCSYYGTVPMTMDITISGSTVTGTATRGGVCFWLDSCGIADFGGTSGTVTGTVSGSTIHINYTGIYSGECAGDGATESFTGTITSTTINGTGPTGHVVSLHKL